MKKDNPIISFVNVIGQIIAFFAVILWLLCLLNGALSADNFLGHHPAPNGHCTSITAS